MHDDSGIFILILKVSLERILFRVTEMTQEIETLAAKPGNVSSMHRTHNDGRRKLILVSWPLTYIHILEHAHTNTYIHTHTINKDKM